LKGAIDIFEHNVTFTQYSTISDLQTAMIVRQRLEEAREYLEAADMFFLNESANKTNAIARERAIMYVALTVERLKTSLSWAKLFDMPGKKYTMDEEFLKASCVNIVDNSHSLIQYARLYFPNIFTVQENSLRELSVEEDPLYCIAKASRIKAEVNAIVGSFGTTSEQSLQLVDRKLGKAKEIIAEEILNERFPILGYSYYEYSKTLRETDPVSSLLYSEYALELSNLDLYFEQTSQTTNIQKPLHKFKLDLMDIYAICLILLAIFAGFIIGLRTSKKHYEKHYHIKKRNK